jgi:solute carrier family 25 uncoupling protein 8/9
MILTKGFMKDNLLCHFTCGFAAGLAAVTIGSPVDVMKTRIMSASVDSKYNGVFDCFWKTLKNEGPLAFYSGFTANFGRIVTWNIAMFMALEQVKGAVNKKFYD